MMARTNLTTVPKKPFRARNAWAFGMLLLCSGLLTGTALVGCKGLWEDQKELWHDRTHPPDPWQEVKSPETNPDRRARFVAQLEEPLQHGGNQAQQDEMVNLLINMAVADPSPRCRLAAIHKLGQFKDQRRLETLQKAYDKATTFADEINSQLRQQVLRSLAETRDPAAAIELIRVARAAAKENNYHDQQLTLDERQTAVRGLANFRGAEVTGALLYILRTEKDIALRDIAASSLETSTGRHLPRDKAHDDAQAWEQVLNANPDAAPPKTGGPLQLIKGWQDR
jgi:hypothetical protein